MTRACETRVRRSKHELASSQRDTHSTKQNPHGVLVIRLSPMMTRRTGPTREKSCGLLGGQFCGTSGQVRRATITPRALGVPSGGSSVGRAWSDSMICERDRARGTTAATRRGETVVRLATPATRLDDLRFARVEREVADVDHLRALERGHLPVRPYHDTTTSQHRR